jgi:hypothetical protein
MSYVQILLTGGGSIKRSANHIHILRSRAKISSKASTAKGKATTNNSLSMLFFNVASRTSFYYLNIMTDCIFATTTAECGTTTPSLITSNIISTFLLTMFFLSF